MSIRNRFFGLCLAVGIGSVPAGRALAAEPPKAGVSSALVDVKVVDALPGLQEKKLEKVEFAVSLVRDARTFQAIAKAAEHYTFSEQDKAVRKGRHANFLMDKPPKVDWSKEAVLVVVQKRLWNAFRLQSFTVTDGTGTLLVHCRIKDTKRVGPGPKGTVPAAVQVVAKEKLKKIKVMLDLGNGPASEIASFEIGGE